MGERTRNERGSTYFRARRGSVHGLIYQALDKGLTRSLTAQIFVLRISKLPQIQGRGVARGIARIRRSGGNPGQFYAKFLVGRTSTPPRSRFSFYPSLSLFLSLFVPFLIHFRSKFYSSSAIETSLVFGILKSPKSPRLLINTLRNSLSNFVSIFYEVQIDRICRDDGCVPIVGTFDL